MQQFCWVMLPRSKYTFLWFTALFCFASCNRECCDCTGSEIYNGTFCEDELPANFSSWEGCRTALKEGGCRCD